MKSFSPIRFILSISVCFLAGGIGSAFTISSIPTWYATLHKPFFNPPNWLFGPVWSLLYFLMGCALYTIWIAHKKKKNNAYIYFFIQLFLNAGWSVIFFGMRLPFFALLDLILLWIFVLLSIREFFRIDKLSATLLIPYQLWISFAGALNIAIVVLNR